LIFEIVLGVPFLLRITQRAYSHLSPADLSWDIQAPSILLPPPISTSVIGKDIDMAALGEIDIDDVSDTEEAQQVVKRPRGAQQPGNVYSFLYKDDKQGESQCNTCLYDFAFSKNRTDNVYPSDW
jgi:hypothetical protein